MRVLAVDALRPDAAAIEDAVRVLRDGGLVAFPTETVYGLGARALSKPAVLRIFAAKGRPSTHPLIVHVAGEDGARNLAAEWTAHASRLAGALWPGPLTLVVARASMVPDVVAGGSASSSSSSVALRVPAHPVARALIDALGEPVAAPSANRYQGLSPTTAAHVVKQLGSAVDLVLDGGPCDAGIESTVVDVRGPVPRVLRPGAVPMAVLRDLVPEVVFATESVSRDEPRPAPGMDARHYAPRATMLLEDGAEAARRRASRMAIDGGVVGLVTLALDDGGQGRGHGATPPAYPANGVDRVTDSSMPQVSEGARPGRGVVVERVLPRAPRAYARSLYATLHELDDAGARAIVVERVPSEEAWIAVADRLGRAACSDGSAT